MLYSFVEYYKYMNHWVHNDNVDNNNDIFMAYITVFIIY